MNKKQKNKKIKQGGFTLAEMLVAIGMISILLSIGGLSIIHYQKVLKLSELDTTAREIFVVVQNQIIKAKATGEWEALIKTYKDHTDTYLGQSMQEKPSDYPSEETWPEGGKGSGHDYRYIVYNNAVETLDNTVLNKILPYGAIDEHVRKEGQYIIEYDYQTGNVYGVFYTDSNQPIDYERDIMSISGLNHNNGREGSQRGRQARKNYKNDSGHMIIGYYGGAVVDNLDSTQLEGLEQPKITVNNGDRLEIIIEDENYGKLIDGVKAQTKLALTVTGEESKSTETKILEIGGMRTNRDSVDENWWSDEVADKKAKYTLILDDISREGGRFADIFEEFIPGENIIIEVEAFSEEVLCIPVKAQAYTNSLFADNYAEDASTAKAIISNIRHLKNLNPKISNIPTEKLEDEGQRKVGRIVKKVEQIQDIEGNNFESIDNTAITEYEGNGHTLSKFNLQPNDSGNVGLFAQVGKEGITIKNLILEGFISETQTEGASAGTLIGEVKEGELNADNVLVINPTVKATNKGYAGGLVGKMSNGQLSQCRVYLTDEDDKSGAKKYELGAYNATNNIQGNQYMVASSSGVAGGLVGIIENTSIRESFAAIPVIDSSNGIAGGLVGKNSGQSTTITNSYTSGYTIEGKYSDYYGVAVLGQGGRAGGLIGQDGAHVTTIDNSYSTASIYGDIVGGFVGDVYGNTSTYKNCYATGKVTGINTSSSRDGFIGKLNDVSIEKSYYLKQSNTDLKDSKSTAQGLDYEEFISRINEISEGPKGKSSPYDPALKNTDYPFRAVTKMKEDIIHYGDWPVKDEQTTTGGGEVGILYYEIIENKLYYHGYFGKFSSNESNPEYQEVMTEGPGLVNGLVTDINRYVSEDGYLIVVPENTNLNDIVVAYGDKQNVNGGDRWTLLSCVETFKNKELISIEGYEVYYFSKELNMYSQPYIIIGKNVNEWYPTLGEERVSFIFNPYFGEGVKIKEVPTEEFHIRSARHLLNMTKLINSYSNKENVEYIQSLDINYEDIKFTQNGKEQTYDYLTIERISADYTVKEHNDGTRDYSYVIKGLKVPLFGTIEESSTVKGVTLLNSKVEGSWGTGGFANTNEGVIENCSIRAENPKGNNDSVIIKGSGNVAGFVYYNNKGTIRNSYFAGTVKGQTASGFVVTNEGTIESSSVHAEIPGSNGYNSIVVEGSSNAAGFAHSNNGGTIRNSYFVGTVKGEIASGFVDTSRGNIESSYANVILRGNTSAAGFTRYHNGGTIKNSFVVGSVKSNNIAYGFMEKSDSGTIDNCYSALFELSGSQIYRFGRGQGSNYSNCVWLDNTYIEGDVQIGEEYGLREQGIALSYEEMSKKGTHPTTHAYNSGYENINQDEKVEFYPFEVISTDDAYLPIEFWGDWPGQEQDPNIYKEMEALLEDRVEENIVEESVVEESIVEGYTIEEGDMLRITQEPMI